MRRSLILDALTRPDGVRNLALADWESLLHEARTTLLAGRLASAVQARAADAVPETVRAPLFAQEDIVLAQHEAVRYEAEEILACLARVGCPVIFLKGSAYVLANNAAARGRLLGDIDILIPREQLEQAELMLKLGGWHNAGHSAYDQRYYRTWMHELPAMHHRERGTVLDVHHTILPPTARLDVDTDGLLAAIQPVAGLHKAFVLAPHDQLLHCATHLFHEGEFEKGLRDLSDFSLLFEQFASEERQAISLAQRGLDMGLGWPLYLALRYTHALFGNSTMPATISVLEDALRPSRMRRKALDALFSHAFVPHVRGYDNLAALGARSLLYIRSHWLRMPPLLLARHLSHKAWLRLAQKETAPER